MARTLRTEAKLDPKQQLEGALYSRNAALEVAQRHAEAIQKLANVKLEFKSEAAPKAAAIRSTAAVRPGARRAAGAGGGAAQAPGEGARAARQEHRQLQAPVGRRDVPRQGARARWSRASARSWRTTKRSCARSTSVVYDASKSSTPCAALSKRNRHRRCHHRRPACPKPHGRAAASWRASRWCSPGVELLPRDLPTARRRRRADHPQARWRPLRRRRRRSPPSAAAPARCSNASAWR